MPTSHPSPRLSWDLFCTVIDNYGDIGITWRLARQLVQEHDQRVRLWVDDLASFHALRPEIDPALIFQLLEGVEVHHWGKPSPAVAPADVVVESLACRLPEEYLLAMAQRTPAPVWINLEYLSAEDWVPGCHGLPSPHPRLPLTQWFFFPGYVPGTGGVLHPGRQIPDPVQAQAQAEFLGGLGVPENTADETRVSLFGYENAALDGLLTAWEQGPAPIRCLVPAGRLDGGLARHFHRPEVTAGQVLHAGRLTLHCLPMLDQDGYDRLLWACDCNFVRGEDSFVRAQWAAHPLVWQAYRQEEAAHWPKIEAFLRLYCAGLPTETAAELRSFWTAWNAEDAAALDWTAYWQQRAALERHAREWRTQLDDLGDLAGNLLQFCAGKL